MAIIPKAQRRVTNLANIPSSAIQPQTGTPEQFGLQDAQTLGQVGSSLQQIGAQALATNTQTKRKAKIRDSVNEFNTFSREYNSSVYDKKAKDAIDVYPESQKVYEDTRNKMADSFTNGIEREMFLSSINPNINNSLNGIFKHQENQISNYEDITLDAQNQNFIDNAVQNRFDSEYIKAQEDGVVANTRFKNNKNGLDGEVAKQNVEASINNFNVQVLESFESPSESSKYLESNWDKFNPSVRTELKERLDKEMEEVFIREKSLEISTSGLTLEQQLLEVDKIKDPGQAKQVRANVKTRYNEKQAIRKGEQQKFVEDEWDDLFENPLSYIIPIKQVDSTTQKQMLIFKNNAIEDYKRSKGLGAGKKTDFILYNELMSMSEEEFLKQDLNSHLSKLAPTEFKELVKNQRALRLNDSEAERTRTFQQQAKDKISGMNQFDPKKGERERTNLNRFMEQFNQKLTTLSPEDRTEVNIGQVVDTLLAPVSIHRPGRNKFFRFEIPYIEDPKQKDFVLEERIPENLQKLSNVNFDKRSNQYYVDVGNMREVYDQFGNLIAKGRRK